jgi:phosphoglycerate dehydrogenase-like enzyme
MGHPALDALRDAGYEVIFSTPGVQPGEEELLRLLPGCVAYLAGVEKVPARVLEAAQGLRVISRNGTGADNIDLEAAKRLNITICVTEGANANGVAELTIALVFALVRAIPFSDAKMKSEQWGRREGIELAGRTLGLVGCGAIGKKVALLGSAIGMQVVAFDPYLDPAFALANFRWVSLDGVYECSDVVSLHCPAPADGKPIIDRGAIAKMKKGVYLVNTARATLLDEDAVLEALASGQIAGVAADVFVKEPPEDYRLVKHDRVIATPHVGGYTFESVLRATQEAVDNILRNLS